MPSVIGGGTFIPLIPTAPAASESESSFAITANTFFLAVYLMVREVNSVLVGISITALPAPPLALDPTFAADADTFVASLPGLVTDVNAVITAFSLSCSAVTALPTTPSRGGDPVDFPTRAAAEVAALPTLRTELNAFITALNASVASGGIVVGGGGGSWTSVHSMVANNVAGGCNNFTLRQMVPASDLLDMSATQMRITMVTEVGSIHLEIDKAFVGPRGSGTWDLASKTQIFWNGGSPSFDLIGTGSAQITSDPFAFSYDGTVDLVFMFYFNASAPSNVVMGPVGGTARVGQKAGGDDTANLVASGYTLSTGVGNVDEIVHLIEVA